MTCGDRVLHHCAGVGRSIAKNQFIRRIDSPLDLNPPIWSVPPTEQSIRILNSHSRIMAASEAAEMAPKETSGEAPGAMKPMFPLGQRPTLGPEATVNPFHESNEWSIPQLMKTIVLIPLLIIRMVCMVSLMAVGYVCIKVVLIGVSDPLFKPFSRWRRSLLWSVRLGARAVLFTMGYYYIPVKGKPAHRSVAPIIVSNHIGFVDPIFVFYRHLPVIVSAKENVEMPIIGMFLQALQVLQLLSPSHSSLLYLSFLLNLWAKSSFCRSSPFTKHCTFELDATCWFQDLHTGILSLLHRCFLSLWRNLWVELCFLFLFVVSFVLRRGC